MPNNDSSEETQTKLSDQPECRYGECRRNHAASIGRYATDGCGEFLFSHGKDVDVDALLCAACGCHRNFHRKVGDSSPMAAAAFDQPEASPLRMMVPPPPITKEMMEEAERRRRRKRTKFTEEQKGKMMVFATEKLGWKAQRHDDGKIDDFCKSVGICKRVFKIWLSNNKHRKDMVASVI
ncbi:hypothetical protein ACFE04_015291 [Oxalis oulophora]